MKKLLISCALLTPLLLAGCSHPQPYYPPPPSAYSQVAQEGYHDGWQAGQRDLRRGLNPDVNRHPRFRQPPVGPRFVDDYRHGFRDGYQRAFHTPPPGY